MLTSLEVAVALASPGCGRRRARRGGARHVGAALRARRPLRRDQRVHQVDARIRSRRRRVLAGADARGGRGRPVHRPADGDPRQRGRRDGRPAGAARRGRRGARRRARRAAGGPAQPRPGGRAPGDGAEEQPCRAGDLERAGGRPRRCASARFRRTCATPATRAPASIGHGAGYEYPHDHEGGWVAQQYLPDELADRRWYRPSRARARAGDRTPAMDRATSTT